MSQADISTVHQDSKTENYWNNLTQGGTGAYKERKIDELIRQFGPTTVKSMIDIGCGTCELLFKYQSQFKADSIVCMDYDSKVIDFLKARYPDQKVEWLVQDIFTLASTKRRFDMIFLLDMIHEVYSFYGRPNRDISNEVSHEMGVNAVDAALDNICAVTMPGGGIVISDNVLSEESKPVQVKIKNSNALESVNFFLANYPTKKIRADFLEEDVIEINSRDLCILLTQYNKIKAKNWDRWNVEKMEIHQYLSDSEFRQKFDQRGFDLHSLVETPADAAEEWNADFEMVNGLTSLPPKRITLIAIKREGIQ